jgi:ABC-type Zn uptake system ZnuABC Zn-binding protein ZnuA
MRARLELPNFLLAVLASFLSLPGLSAAASSDPLKVVATIPDLADIAREIGGDRVEVTSICRGRENAHAVVVRPSHLVALNKADLFVQVGLSLETAFVPALLEGCRNPKVQPGKPGFVNGSEGWQAIGVPASLSRAAGDVHPQGNPHMNLDPRAGRHIAGRVLAALAAVDPANEAAYERRHAAYCARLAEAEKRWAELGAAWKGKKVAVYHQEFDYLAAAYGLEIAGTVEVKPGIPPTPNHVADLIAQMKREGVGVILTAVWSNTDQVARIADATAAKVVELPNMCGGIPGTDTWIAMMDLVHRRLADAFGAGAR